MTDKTSKWEKVKEAEAKMLLSAVTPSPPSLSPIVLVYICMTNPWRSQGICIIVKSVAVEGQGRRIAREGRAGKWEVNSHNDSSATSACISSLLTHTAHLLL
jgi:hypothetical protein